MMPYGPNAPLHCVYGHSLDSSDFPCYLLYGLIVHNKTAFGFSSLKHDRHIDISSAV